MITCDVCGAELQGDVCPNCPPGDEAAWIQQHAVIAPDPQSHEAHELAIAIYTLQHPERYDGANLTWARSVIERHLPGS